MDKKTHKLDENFVQESPLSVNSGIPSEIKISLKEPRPGTVCPRCHEGVLDYNGLLNLECTKCGYTLAGCST